MVSCDSESRSRVGAPDRSLNRINERHNEIVSYITEKLQRRPDLLDKCIPSYPPFGKRILIDNGWFDTLCQPHVTRHRGDRSILRNRRANE